PPPADRGSRRDHRLQAQEAAGGGEAGRDGGEPLARLGRRQRGGQTTGFPQASGGQSSPLSPPPGGDPLPPAIAVLPSGPGAGSASRTGARADRVGFRPGSRRG